MQIPIIKGLIERRILVNFRVDPAILARVVPSPFRPKVVAGAGIAGICLIRLSGLRPRWLPRFAGLGNSNKRGTGTSQHLNFIRLWRAARSQSPFCLSFFGSENAAHRIAVEWDEPDGKRDGVYIPRRDSSSRWNALAGGRLFPGMHRHSRFHVSESGDRYSVGFSNQDGMRVAIEGCVCRELPAGSIFGSLRAASEFFAAGAIGYSPARRPGSFEGLELRTSRWNMTPLSVSHVESSWFSDAAVFPAGSVEFDSALLMREIPHEWHSRRPGWFPASGPAMLEAC